MTKYNRKQYTGTLSVEQVAKGIELCVENASDLLEEATLLYKNGRYARAFSLIVLAEEEMGKIPMIARPIWFKDKAEWKKFWKRFRRYEEKYSDALSLDFLFLPEKELEDTIKEMKTIPPVADELKQQGFYVDCVNGRFTIPKALFKKNFIEFMMRVANGRSDVLKKLHSDGRTLIASRKMLRCAKEPELKRPPKMLEDHVQFWIKMQEINNPVP